MSRLQCSTRDIPRIPFGLTTFCPQTFSNFENILKTKILNIDFDTRNLFYALPEILHCENKSTANES
jgi:hypothetical protein